MNYRPRHRKSTALATSIRAAAVLAIGAILLAAAPAQAASTIRSAYLTGYSWYDNTPPGSAAIAYPRGDYPTKHRVAAGQGSYDNPVTLAVGWHQADGPLYKPGSRFYLPFLHKYVMVEDACGDRAEAGPCYQLDQAPAGASTWLDVWVDGHNHPRSASDLCMDQITDLHTVVFQPKRGYPVHYSSITTQCQRGKFYSEKVPALRP